MTDKENKRLIRELHEKFMIESMKQIGESIGSIQGFAVHDTPEVQEDVHSSAPDVRETTAPSKEEHSGPEKIVEIRNQIAAAQSPGVLIPDKQRELMEIVKQQSEAFEKELRKSESANRTRAASQSFKDELLNNVHLLLTERKYAFSN
ncbi:MAG TPA: hypothetical protein VK658_17010 [Chryseolinea sp.]|nr:hypothetical protein [Chryseolinea sp.]